MMSDIWSLLIFSTSAEHDLRKMYMGMRPFIPAAVIRKFSICTMVD